MTKRRSRGDGGLHWDENRQRWIATVTVGYDARGKRITRRASGKTKTEAKEKLKELIRDYDDGLSAPASNYTVGNAITHWLEHGLSGRDPNTVGKSAILSTRSLQIIYSILSRAIKKAQVQDKIRRNIVLLCEVPEGRAGRPSKSLTLRQAEAVLKAAEQGSPRMRAYIVVSLLTGARTEEMRALRWCDVDLEGHPDVDPPVPPHLVLVRSVRAGGDTKTRKSR